MAGKCQSCGMPMKGKDNLFGTNSDGSFSTEYCHYCFQEGAFTQPELTVSDMQTFCTAKLREMGFPKPLAWLFTRNIPSLRRWRDAPP